MGIQALRIEFHRKKEVGKELYLRNQTSISFQAFFLSFFFFLKQIKLECVPNYLNSECSWNRDCSGQGGGHYLSFMSSENYGAF